VHQNAVIVTLCKTKQHDKLEKSSTKVYTNVSSNQSNPMLGFPTIDIARLYNFHRNKIPLCSKHKWLGHILSHKCLPHDITEGKIMGKSTRGEKEKFLHAIMRGRDYIQLKVLISDRARWKQDNIRESISETYW